ncbi:MAG: hypothetical protein KGD64_07640 [Candidatus Heimdallarchaeota archaeon]|nr:hypothetical protein [Candidatus Heimdallarchaeota archaeon]
MKKRKIFSAFIICFVTITPVLANDDAGSPDLKIARAFSINLLSPNTQETRNEWAVIIQEQLPKIGIGVFFHESTGWGNIAPRTTNYPLIDYDYIPTYAEGGFDVLISGWDWGMDFNPGLRYSAGCWVSGNNYYQYTNPAFDNKLWEYFTVYDPDERDQLAYDIQEILYEDLPAISILYESSFFLIDGGISGIAPLLSKVRSDHSENWNNTDSFDLIYSNKYELNSYNTFQLEKENYLNTDQNFDHLWAQCVYGSLYRRSLLDYSWEPYIAENATIIPHYYGASYPVNMSIVIDINPDAKFSNGDSVLAEDIKYSYDLHLSLSAHSSTYNHLLTQYFTSNDSIIEVDSDTVRFDLRKVFNFPYSLLSYGLVDKSTVEPIISTYGNEVLKEAPFSVNASDSIVTSCGPFKLDSYNVMENKVVLTSNEYWFGSTQGLSNITFVSIPDKNEALTLLKEKEVDVLDENYDFQYAEFLIDYNSEIIESFEFVFFPSLKHQEIGINLKHPVMGTGELTPLGTAEAAKNIRKAISHAIPRWSIIDDILDGVGTEGVTPIPPGCIGFDSSLEPYAYDLDHAISLVEEAGFIGCCFTPTYNADLFFIPLLISLVFVISINQSKRR